MIDANTKRQVIEYLCKKGYTRTEAMLRLESANQDAEGKPIHARAEDAGGAKYGKALGEYRTRGCRLFVTKIDIIPQTSCNDGSRRI